MKIFKELKNVDLPPNPCSSKYNEVFDYVKKNPSKWFLIGEEDAKLSHCIHGRFIRRKNQGFKISYRINQKDKTKINIYARYQ